MINSGAQANSNGNQLESFVEESLVQRGYKKVNNSWLFAHRHSDVLKGQYYAKQVYVGETIYGTDRVVDFFLVNRCVFPLDFVIECKWQQANGSVDEKYPFLHLNIRKTGIPTGVLIDGGGYKPGAEVWLRGQVDGDTFKAVWTMREFYTVVNSGFLGTGCIKSISLVKKRVPKRIEQLALPLIA